MQVELHFLFREDLCSSIWCLITRGALYEQPGQDGHSNVRILFFPCYEQQQRGHSVLLSTVRGGWLMGNHCLCHVLSQQAAQTTCPVVCPGEW